VPRSQWIEQQFPNQADGIVQNARDVRITAKTVAKRDAVFSVFPGFPGFATIPDDIHDTFGPSDATVTQPPEWFNARADSRRAPTFA